MPDFIYEGNVNATNSSTSLSYDGTDYAISDKITLTDAEYERLSPYFVFTPADSKPDETPVSTDEKEVTEVFEEPPVETSTSPSADTIPQEKSSPSASSKS